VVTFSWEGHFREGDSWILRNHRSIHHTRL
jgi:hypothetical protein